MKNRFAVNQIPTSDLMAMYRAYREKDEFELKAKQAKGAIPRDGVIPREDFKCVNSDDCKNLLHDARFLRLPCAAQEKWYHKVKIAHTPTVITSMPLEASGVAGEVSPRVIELMHDRSKIVKLSDFFNGDLDSGSKKDIEDTEWDTVAGVYRCKKAVGNYTAVEQQLWPMDTTPVTLIRMLNKYHYCSGIKNVFKRQRAIQRYFNEVMEKNAHRATNGLPPLSFVDHEVIIKDKISDAGVVPMVPIECDEISADAASQQAQTSSQPSGGYGGYGGGGGFRGRGRGDRGGRGRGRGGRGRGGGGGGTPTPKAMSEGLHACRSFNNEPKCSNHQMGNGRCMRVYNGTEEWYIHVCNVYLEDKKKHCLGNHSRLKCDKNKN